jgi:hypothetical protein
MFIVVPFGQKPPKQWKPNQGGNDNDVGDGLGMEHEIMQAVKYITHFQSS